MKTVSKKLHAPLQHLTFASKNVENMVEFYEGKLGFFLSDRVLHWALFARKSFNDFLGFWVCGCPILADLFSYRRFHLMHHKYTQTEKDPDKVLSRPFPVTQLSLFRKFLRDLTGQTGVL